MSTDYACEYCGRSNFTSQYGLTQHQSKGACYEALVRDLGPTASPRRLRSNRLSDGVGMPRNVPAPPHKEEGMFRRLMEVDDSDIDALARGINELFADEEGVPAGSDEEEDAMSDEDNDSVSSGLPSLSGSAGSDSEDEDDDDDAPPIPDEVETSDEEDEEDEGPIEWIRDQFREYCEEFPKNNEAHLSEEEAAAIRLIDLLFKKKTPMNAHRDLMIWHLQCKGDLQDGMKLGECEEHMSREVMMKRLKARYNMANKCPHQKKVRLPISGEIVRLTLHDPQSCIQSLLTDPRILDSDYAFFGDDPLAPPPTSQTTVGDIQTGNAHRKTYQKIIDPDPAKRQQLIPIMLYVDGSAVSHFHNFEVTQVKMSLGTLTRTARMRGCAWRVLGHIEKVHQSGGMGREMYAKSQHMEVEDGAASDDSDSSIEELPGVGEENAQDLHAQIACILDPLVPILKRGFLWDLRYKGVLYRDIHFKGYIAFVRCDNKEADELCGKYGTRQKRVKHICRMCDCPTRKADHHLYEPTYKREPKIKRLVDNGDVVGLKEISQHYLINAFHGLPFHLANDRGIHGACPVDMLHTVQLGIFKCVRDIFFEQLGKSSKAAKLINGLSKVHMKQFAHQSDKTMPPMRFSKGIQEGKLMGRDYRGVLLLMMVLCQTHASRSVIKASRGGTKTRGNFKEDYLINDWADILELLLLWEAHLHVPEMEAKDLRRLDMKQRYLMYLMRMVCQRIAGMGLKVVKFHNILHIVDNVKLCGVPLESDTSPNESHHIPTKQAARLTQQTHSTFNKQTAGRLVDFETVNFAMEELESGNAPWAYYLGLREEPTEQESDDGSGGPINMEVSCNDMEVSLDVESIDNGVDVNSDPSNHGVDLSDDDDLIGIKDQEEPITEPGDAMIKVYVEDDGEVNFHMVSRSKHNHKATLNEQLIYWLNGLQSLLKEELDGNCLRIYTRIKRGGRSFRAHPNYRGKGPWRDWVWVDCGRDGHYPCHIWAFVVIPPIEGDRSKHYGGISLEEGVFACVECANVIKQEREGLSKLEMMHPIEKVVGLDDDGQVLLDGDFQVAGRKFFLADTQAFLEPCCVIPDVGGPRNRYYLIENRENWPEIFQRWLQTPIDDDMVIEGDLTDDEATEEEELGNDGTEEDNNSTMYDQNPQEMEDALENGGESSSETT